MEIYSKAVDETWVRARPNGAFYAYDENLKIQLDILELLPLNIIPPALLESVTYNLERLAGYIGDSLGESRAAYRTWFKRRDKIPEDTQHELLNIAKSRNRRLYKLIHQKPKDSS
jgi:hypothetical protein